MRPTSEVVYLVDEDLRVREALSELLSSQERQHFSLARLRNILHLWGRTTPPVRERTAELNSLHGRFSLAMDTIEMCNSQRVRGSVR
jgi:hypothetical protein